MREIELITPDKIDYYWPLMAQELDHIPHTWGRMTKQSMYERIQEGALQVWGIGEEGSAIELVVMTQFVNYDTGRVFQIVHAFGRNLMHWLPLLAATFEKTAWQAGCREIEVIGRDGWKKILAPHGFRQESIVLSKKISDWRMQ